MLVETPGVWQRGQFLEEESPEGYVFLSYWSIPHTPFGFVTGAHGGYRVFGLLLPVTGLYSH